MYEVVEWKADDIVILRSAAYGTQTWIRCRSTAFSNSVRCALSGFGIQRNGQVWRPSTAHCQGNAKHRIDADALRRPPAAPRVCTHCGYYVPRGSGYCTKCGTQNAHLSGPRNTSIDK